MIAVSFIKQSVFIFSLCEKSLCGSVLHTVSVCVLLNGYWY